MEAGILLIIIAIAIWRFISSRRLTELLQESKVATPPTRTSVSTKEYSKNTKYKTNNPKVVQKKKYESSLDSEEIKEDNEIAIDFDHAKAIIYSEIIKPKYF